MKLLPLPGLSVIILPLPPALTETQPLLPLKQSLRLLKLIGSVFLLLLLTKIFLLLLLETKLTMLSLLLLQETTPQLVVRQTTPTPPPLPVLRTPLQLLQPVKETTQLTLSTMTMLQSVHQPRMAVPYLIEHMTSLPSSQPLRTTTPTMLRRRKLR